jgi:predicted HTH domain antitoxin
MPLVISDEILRAAHLTEDELRREVAVFLFSLDKLTLGKAAQLAGMRQLAFQRLLGSRRIPIHYDIEDLEQDIANLKEMGLL